MQRRQAVLVAAAIVAVVGGAWMYGRSASRGSQRVSSVALVSTQSPSRCGEGYSRLYVSFSFVDRESPWQRSRPYELELQADEQTTHCEFEVPPRSPELDMPDPSQCRFALLPSGEPGSITLAGRPHHVRARILSAGVVFYSGEVSPKYEPDSEDCEYRATVPLLSVDTRK